VSHVKRWVDTLNRPVRLFLRIEVALPFAFFSWPLSGIAALIFATVNMVSEDDYLGQAKFLSKLLVLTKGCVANAVLLGLGVCMSARFTHLQGGQRWIDWENVRIVVLACLIVLLIMLAWRVLLLAIEHHFVPWVWRRAKEVER